MMPFEIGSANKSYKNFTVQCDYRGVWRVSLDVPNHAINVFNREVMDELDSIVTDLEQSERGSIVVFESGKESGFLAGADVRLIEAIGNEKDAAELLELGQKLFARIERLSMVTLAVIHGPCLGGGLELALACDHRVARDNSSTKIGLPEIKLGLIPGWGGTQRLPRLIGLTKSLSMILQGSDVDAKQAHQIGLVDEAISPEQWPESVEDFIARRLSGGRMARPKRRFDAMRLLEHFPFGRRLIIHQARKKISNKVQDYPALQAAIDAIEDGFRRATDGFKSERQGFAKLITTPTCRHLLRLFFSRESARSLSTWTRFETSWMHLPPVRTLGIIGAGAMGAGIARVAASRGYPVNIKEIDSAAADQGRIRIGAMLDDYARHKHSSPKVAAEMRSRVAISHDPAILDGCDCVVEAVVERMDVKKLVLESTESQLSSSAILTTNTSSLSVNEMESVLSRPECFAGLHFFNPVERMELVEIVRGDKTSDETIFRLVTFVRSLGKTPVVTKDSPGFLVNRILFPYLAESILMAIEGHDIETIDRQIRKFGMPMGPLELLDQVGLDVALHVAASLRSVLGNSGPIEDVLHQMVSGGRLGRKSGQGFYEYRGKQKHPLPRVAGLSCLMAKIRTADMIEAMDFGMTATQKRLIYPMLLEAIRCDEESVTQYPWAIDLAMVLGTGFASHRGGPLACVDSIGTRQFKESAETLGHRFGRRFEVPSKLARLADVNGRFLRRAPDHPLTTK
jgi:3-hydroxyacyl-CoA dehydrogenase/enoyl-CoA hydratase/carnithine racemase